MHKGHGGRGTVQVGFEAIKAGFEMAQSATMDYLNISERQLHKTSWANNVFKWPHRALKMTGKCIKTLEMTLPPARSKNPADRDARQKGLRKIQSAKATKNNGVIRRSKQCSMASTKVLLGLRPAGALPHEQHPLTPAQQLVDDGVEAILALYLPASAAPVAHKLQSFLRAAQQQQPPPRLR